MGLALVTYYRNNPIIIHQKGTILCIVELGDNEPHLQKARLNFVGRKDVTIDRLKVYEAKHGALPDNLGGLSGVPVSVRSNSGRQPSR